MSRNYWYKRFRVTVGFFFIYACVTHLEYCLLYSKLLGIYAALPVP